MTLALFFYAYLVVLAVFALYSLFNIYHLLRFGFLTVTNVAIIVGYLSISTALILSSFVILNTIDWHAPIFASFDSSVSIYGQ